MSIFEYLMTSFASRYKSALHRLYILFAFYCVGLGITISTCPLDVTVCDTTYSIMILLTSQQATAAKIAILQLTLINICLLLHLHPQHSEMLSRFTFSWYFTYGTRITSLLIGIQLVSSALTSPNGCCIS